MKLETLGKHLGETALNHPVITKAVELTLQLMFLLTLILSAVASYNDEHIVWIPFFSMVIISLCVIFPYAHHQLKPTQHANITPDDIEQYQNKAFKLFPVMAVYAILHVVSFFVTAYLFFT